MNKWDKEFHKTDPDDYMRMEIAHVISRLRWMEKQVWDSLSRRKTAQTKRKQVHKALQECISYQALHKEFMYRLERKLVTLNDLFYATPDDLKNKTIGV